MLSSNLSLEASRTPLKMLSGRLLLQFQGVFADDSHVTFSEEFQEVFPLVFQQLFVMNLKDSLISLSKLQYNSGSLRSLSVPLISEEEEKKKE